MKKLLTCLLVGVLFTGLIATQALSASGIGKRAIEGEPLFIQGGGWWGGQEIDDPGTPPTGEWWFYINKSGDLHVETASADTVISGLTSPVGVTDGGTGLSTIADQAIWFATASNTVGSDAVNFGWDNTTNGDFLYLGGGTGVGQLRFLEGSGGGTNYTGWKANTTLAGNTVYTMPIADATSALQGLTSNASLATSWKPFQSVLAANITASTIAGNASATAFTFTGEGSDTIAANRLSVGSVVKIRIAGSVTTDSDGSETVAHVFAIGSKTILSTGALDVHGTSVTASPWVFDCELTELTAGGTGTCTAAGTLTYKNGTATAVVLPFDTLITSFDTTATEQVKDTVTWASGDASPDVIQMDIFNISYNNFD